MKKHPRPTTDEGKKKFVKSEMEALQEKLDCSALLDELKVDFMAATTTEFDKYAGGMRTSPWVAYSRLNDTMFGM
jgi:hypothetical protein